MEGEIKGKVRPRRCESPVRSDFWPVLGHKFGETVVFGEGEAKERRRKAPSPSPNPNPFRLSRRPIEKTEKRGKDGEKRKRQRKEEKTGKRGEDREKRKRQRKEEKTGK